MRRVLSGASRLSVGYEVSHDRDESCVARPKSVGVVVPSRHFAFDVGNPNYVSAPWFVAHIPVQFAFVSALENLGNHAWPTVTFPPALLQYFSRMFIKRPTLGLM